MAAAFARSPDRRGSLAALRCCTVPCKAETDCRLLTYHMRPLAMPPHLVARPCVASAAFWLGEAQLWDSQAGP
ncbi:hypothetical protein BV20DRAFT_973187 [Pilatotrama ljubarskyi]|nr:hypothetical protein BV20DRAFT_973187 [Pilatotrama ljubarskyi]